MAVAKCFAVDAETLCAPSSCSHEDCFIAVAEEVVYAECTADCRVRADVNAKRAELLLVTVNRRERQAEIRNAIAQHAANLLHTLEDRDPVALLCKLYADDNAGGSRANYGDVVSVVGLACEYELVEIGIRDVVLNA